MHIDFNGCIHKSSFPEQMTGHYSFWNLNLIFILNLKKL